MDRQTKQYLRQSAADNKLLLQNQQNTTTKFARMLPSSGYLSNINNQLLDYSLIDNDLLLKNQNLGLESNPSNIPLKISASDQKLLKTYVDNLPRNYQFQAEDGSIKYRKYQSPNDIPNLEEVSSDVIDMLEVRKSLEDERDKKLKIFINLYNECLVNIDKLQNKEPKKFELMLEKNKIDYKEYQKNITKIEKDLAKNQENLIKISNNVSKLLSEYDIKLAEYDDYVKEDADIKARNLQKANAYQDIFNVYNQGAMSTQKEDFETEQEYLDRLQQFSEQLVPENELENARQYVSKLFRQRMKDLILPDVVIEQVANSVDPVSSGSVNNKQRLLNNWAYIKSKFLSTYGPNPKMTADEIIDFFNFVSSLDVSKGVIIQPQSISNPVSNDDSSVKSSIKKKNKVVAMAIGSPVASDVRGATYDEFYTPKSDSDLKMSDVLQIASSEPNTETRIGPFMTSYEPEPEQMTVVPKYSGEEKEYSYTPKNLNITPIPQDIQEAMIKAARKAEVEEESRKRDELKALEENKKRSNEILGVESGDSYVFSRPVTGEKVLFFYDTNDKGVNKIKYLIGGFGYFRYTALNTELKRMGSKEHISRYLGLDTEGKQLGKLFGVSGVASENKMVDFLKAKKIPKCIDSPEFRPTDKVPTYQEYEEKYGNNPVGQMSSSSSQEGSGLGVSANDFPKYVHFGSVLLELRKLHHHNELVIKDHRKCAIYGFPSIKVSDNFSNIIINMVHKNEPSFSDLSRLNSHEKELYDVLIALAGLKKRIYNTHDNTISTLKNRLNLLEGEIEIGNNNPKIYNEIRKILFKLHHLKVISMKQVQNHLKQIG